MAENLTNDVQTTLNGSIDASTTSITVTSGTGFPTPNFRVRLDDEWMLVTSTGAGTNWTVTRGIEGSVASAHANAAAVVHVLTEGGLEQYIADRFGDALGVGGAIRLNPQTISEDLTIPGTSNAISVGPMTIATSYTVTVSTGATWVIV